MASSSGADGVTPGPDAAVENPFADLYDRAVDALIDVPVGEEWVDTRAGRTHVLTAGDPDAPPLVVFQGGNVTNPITLSWFQGLADDYRLLAPDTVGEPGKSAPERPDDYGPWVVDVLDSLDIDTAPMLGPSHGAGVVLEAAVHAPDRVVAGGLVVPAGFGTPVSLALARVVVPSLVYRVVSSRWLLDRALAAMFSQSVDAVDDVVVETIARALRTSDLEAEFPGPDEPADLAGFDAPVCVVTAERDPFFPGGRTCKRAARALPSLETCVMLPEERHFLSPKGQAAATDRVRSFLADIPDT